MPALTPEHNPSAAHGPPGAADFDALYEARYGDVVAMVHALTGDVAEAQDLAQEAFCRAWQRWKSVSTYEEPLAWIRRVAANLAVSRWRRVPSASPGARSAAAARPAAAAVQEYERASAVGAELLGTIANRMGWRHSSRRSLMGTVSTRNGPMLGLLHRGAGALPLVSTQRRPKKVKQPAPDATLSVASVAVSAMRPVGQTLLRTGVVLRDDRCVRTVFLGG
jgi:hypothetical protein